MSAAAENLEAQDVEGIERVPGVCGGYPVIAGTRFSVRTVIEYLRATGWGVDDFHREFPHLRREQIEAALLYYARHPEIVDEDISRNRKAWEEITGTDYDGNPVVPG